MKTHTVRLKQSNMLCHKCVLNVAKALSRMNGIQELDINLEKKEIKIVYSDENIDREKITEIVNKAILTGKV
ncbi:heavy metal-associated domain-containing protein [Petroclostridium sp. X23]|uniref:heavy-metal-associated domain-containing protein n=1 Tax=Petroclostridium sp. X23 TaxID=3045146 RepID=UPI0024AD83F0|nr:heavy metal-associated domain-containing protein [Petroclostridium sp. X23]WHH59979.1 heavy metal-associated domain-containing protein [Petroclostridium sp. X23]